MMEVKNGDHLKCLDNGLTWTRSDKTSQYLLLYQAIAMTLHKK